MVLKINIITARQITSNGLRTYDTYSDLGISRLVNNAVIAARLHEIIFSG
jgi:hypothetical protein